MSKKFLVWLLALCMMLSIVTVSVAAEETEEPNYVMYGTEEEVLGDTGNTGNITTVFQDVLGSATTPMYVKLLGDCTLDGRVANLAGGSEVTLDFNGYKITASGIAYLCAVTNGTSITVVDTKGGGGANGDFENGFLLCNGGNVIFGEGNYTIACKCAFGFTTNAGSLTINGGIFAPTEKHLRLAAAGAQNFKLTVNAPSFPWDGFAVMSAYDATFDLAKALGIPDGYKIYRQGTTTELTGTLTEGRVYVVTAPAEVTVNAVSNNDEYGSVSGGGTFTKGQEVTLTATPKEGYYFAGWYDGETLVSSDASYTFSAVECTLTAKFEQAEVRWGKAEGWSGTDATPAKDDITEWTYGTLDQAVAAMLTDDYADGAYIQLLKNCSADSRYVLKPKYNFTLDLNGMALTANIDYPFNLAGDPGGIVTFTDTNANGGGSISGFTSAAAYVGAKGTLVLGTGDYTISGPSAFKYTGNGTIKVQGGTFETSEADLGFYSKTPTEGGFKFEMEDQLWDGFTIRPKIAISDPYTAFGIPEDYSIYEDGTTTSVDTMTAETTYRIRKPVTTVTVTVESAGNGSVSGGGTVVSGESVTITATPDFGYQFDYWTLEDSEEPIAEAGAEYTIENVTADCTYVAHFTTFTPSKDAEAWWGDDTMWIGDGTLSEALNAANENENITRIQLQNAVTSFDIKDGSVTTKYVQAAASALTIDLNGNMITCTNTNGFCFDVKDSDSTITIADSSVDNAGGVTVTDPEVPDSYAPIYLRDSSKVTVTGGTFTSKVVVRTNANAVGSQLTISGGVFESTTKYPVIHAAGDMEISGGTFTSAGAYIVEMYNDTVTVSITGGTYNIKKDQALLAAKNGKFSFDDEVVSEYAEHLIAAHVTTVADLNGILERTPAGATVSMERDLTDGSVDVTVPANITLELDGSNLTANSLAALGIVKDSKGTSVVTVSDPKYLELKSDNPQFPVFNGTGFVFTTVTHKRLAPVVSENSFTWTFRPEFGDANACLADGTASNVTIQIRVMSNQLNNGYAILAFGEETAGLVKRAYSENKAFKITVTGISGIDDLTAQLEVVANDVVVADASYEISYDAPAESYGLVASKTSVAPNDTFTVSVKIPPIEKLLSGVQVDVKFDPAAFQVTSFNPTLPEGATGDYNSSEEGFISLLAYTASGENEIDLTDGYTMTAEIKVLNTASAGERTFSFNELVIEYLDGDTPCDATPSGMAKTVTVTVTQ